MTVSFNAALNAYNNAAKISTTITSPTVENTSDTGFSSIISNSLQNTALSLQQAEATTAKSLVKQADITDVVSAITSAEITLKSLVGIRDRMVAAYQEILRMPI